MLLLSIVCWSSCYMYKFAWKRMRAWQAAHHPIMMMEKIFSRSIFIHVVAEVRTIAFIIRRENIRSNMNEWVNKMRECVNAEWFDFWLALKQNDNDNCTLSLLSCCCVERLEDLQIFLRREVKCVMIDY